MRKVLLCSTLLGLAAFALVSCVSTMITANELKPIRRGMSSGSFKAAVAAEPKLVFAVEYQGTPYSVEVFDMQTGTRTVHGTQFVYSPYGSYTIPTTTVVPVTADFLFLFASAGLTYWGFFTDLQREDDPTLQGLAPVVAAEYENQKRIADEKRRKQLEEQALERR